MKHKNIFFAVVCIFLALLCACSSGSQKPSDQAPSDSDFYVLGELGEGGNTAIFHLSEGVLFQAEVRDEVFVLLRNEMVSGSNKEFCVFGQGERLWDFGVFSDGSLLCVLSKEGDTVGEQTAGLIFRYYDSEGSLLEEKNVGSLNGEISFSRLRIGKDDGICLALDRSLYQFDKDGELLRKMEELPFLVAGIYLDKSGNVFLTENNGPNTTVYKFQEEKMEMQSVRTFPTEMHLIDCAMGVFLADGTSLYEMNESGEISSAADLSARQINGFAVQGISEEAQGSYVLFLYDIREPKEFELAGLMKEEKEALPADSGKTEIYLAAINPNSFNKWILNFNRGNKTHEIVLKNYSRDVEERLRQIDASLLAKDAPDIVEVFAGVSTDTLQNYIQKGALEDLMPYLQNSDQIHPDDFLERTVSDFSVGGKLYALPTSFTLQTLACSEEILNGKTSWDTEQFLDFMEQYPNAYNEPGWEADGIRRSLLEMILYKGIYEFVDPEEGVCSFDDGRFASILERIKNLEISSVSESREERSLSGEVVLWKLNLYQTRNLQEAQWQNGHGKKLALIGYPAGNREEQSGAFLMYSNVLVLNQKSSEKEAAWGFLESYLKSGL